SFCGFFFFQAEDGIRDFHVTGVQTCALPIYVARRIVDKADDPDVHLIGFPGCYPNAYAGKIMRAIATHPNVGGMVLVSLGCESRSEERRVGKECRSGGSAER